MKLPKSIVRQIQDRLDAEVISTKALSGGSINRVEHLILSSEKEIVVKYNNQAPKGIFSAEAYGLGLLSKCEIAVPNVLYLEENTEDCQPH